ncbi:MAG TPA: hypothetical protein VI942_03455 [Thermoanaerobaculia bacterium]|nr:hypothetical protein [Thermoanaerobaculia bacterium]
MHRLTDRHGAEVAPGRGCEDRAAPSHGSVTGLVPAAVCLMLLAGYCVLFWQFYIDDTYIHLRYSLHLLEGHGFRFNLDQPPVMGTSSPLWIVVLMLPVRLLRADPLPLVKIIALLLGATSLATLGRCVHRLSSSWYPNRSVRFHRLMGVAPASFLLASGVQWIYFFSGMEPPLYGLLYSAIALLVVRHQTADRGHGALGAMLGLCCLLLFLARPEGAAAIGATCLTLLAVENGRRPALSSFLLTIGFLGSLWVSYALATFGSVLPTAVAAKGANLPWFSQPWGPALFEYGDQLVALFGPTVVLGALLLAATLVLSPGRLLEWARQPLTIFNLAYAAAVLLTYLALNGQRNERYLLVFGPCLALVLSGPAIILSNRIAAAFRPGSRLAVLGPAAVAAVIAVVGFVSASSAYPWYAEHFYRRYEPLKVLATSIRADAEARHAAAGDNRVLLEIAGVLSYYSRASVIDIAGLVSPELSTTSHLLGGHTDTGGPRLAQQREVIRALIFERRPDFIVLKEVQYRTFVAGLFDGRTVELTEFARTPTDATGWGDFVAWRVRYRPR